MRILIQGLNFRPELTGIGKYSGEMAEWLAARGHEVRVVTAPPYYPAWRVAEGYSAASYSRERTNGVSVFRCPLWVPRRQSGLNRLIHLFSYAVSSFPIMLAQARWKPHIVINIAPALMAAPGGVLVSRLARAKLWLQIQDFETAAAFSLGMLKGAAFKKLAASVEACIYRQFDVVSTISNQMMKLLEQKCPAPAKTMFFPNWVDTDRIHPLEVRPAALDGFVVPENGVVALYSGNMGEKQGLDVLIRAARLLQPHPQIHMVLCGDGAAKAGLKRSAAGLENVHFLPLQPENRLNRLLNIADIHVLPQREDAADLVMPSKLLGMLASGRPVAATAHPGTQVAQTVEVCGMVVPPENPDALAEAILALAGDPELRRKLGSKAREYAVNFLGKEAILGRFEKALHELAGRGAGGAASPLEGGLND